MTSASDLYKIRDVATRFRMAIESCDRCLLPVSFEEFPQGSCGDVTPLLGTYLVEQGFGPFDYVVGKQAGTDHSHAWLRQGKLDVDITADQFADASEPVIVCIDSPWHRSFRARVQHVADYRIYDEHTVSVLSTAYRLVIDRLEKKIGPA